MSLYVCPLCGSHSVPAVTGTISSQEYFATANHAYAIANRSSARLDVRRCTACGHGWSPLQPGIDVRSWYANASTDNAYLAEAHGRRTSAIRLLKHLRWFRSPPGTLLDVGAGSGLLVREAKIAGWNARGLEPAAWAVVESQAQGLGDTIQLGDAAALAEMHEESVDVVTAIDVIEHLQDPQQCLRNCAHVVRPGGVIVVVTPRYDSWLARLLGRHWYCIMPAHVHYFSRRSLAELVERSGLELVSVRHYVRWFSLQYLWARLFRRPPSKKTLSWIVPISLFDTLEIIARKR